MKLVSYVTLICSVSIAVAAVANTSRSYSLAHKNFSTLQEAAPAIRSLQEYITDAYNNSEEGTCPDAEFIPGDNFHSIQSIESDSYCNILVTTKANSLLPTYYVKLQPLCAENSVIDDIDSWLVLSNVDNYSGYANLPTELSASRAFTKFDLPYRRSRYSADPVNGNHLKYNYCNGFS